MVFVPRTPARLQRVSKLIINETLPILNLSISYETLRWRAKARGYSTVRSTSGEARKLDYETIGYTTPFPILRQTMHPYM